MGRRTEARRDYVKDSLAVYRLREALRIDATTNEVQRQKAIALATELMETLMRLDNEKGDASNVKRNNKAKG